MTSVKITELLVKLKNRGIGISIIHEVDDLTFPMDRVQKNAKSEQLDRFYSVKGGHNELYLNPEKYMTLVEYAFTSLENKAKKRFSKLLYYDIIIFLRQCRYICCQSNLEISHREYNA